MPYRSGGRLIRVDRLNPDPVDSSTSCGGVEVEDWSVPDFSRSSSESSSSNSCIAGTPECSVAGLKDVFSKDVFWCSGIVVSSDSDDGCCGCGARSEVETVDALPSLCQMSAYLGLTSSKSTNSQGGSTLLLINFLKRTLLLVSNQSGIDFPCIDLRLKRKNLSCGVQPVDVHNNDRTEWSASFSASSQELSGIFVVASTNLIDRQIVWFALSHWLFPVGW